MPDFLLLNFLQYFSSLGVEHIVNTASIG